MASYGIATFLHSVKGSKAVTVDLGGDTPKAIILITTAHDPDNDAVNTGTEAINRGPDFSVGMATTSSDETLNMMTISDNSGIQTSTRRQVARLVWTGTTFSQDWDVQLTSFGPDTVTLNFDNAPISIGYERRFTLIAFGGSDCEVHLQDLNLGTGTSPLDQTGPGFEPDVVFASSANVTALGGSATAVAAMSFGIGINDGSDTQRCYYRAEGGTTLTVSRPSQAVFDDRIYTRHNIQVNPATEISHAVIGDYDASGYSITPSVDSLSTYVTLLAIKAPGVAFHLDDYLTPTATGMESYGGAAFAPTAAVIVGGGAPAINTFSNWVEDAATNYISMVEDATDITKVGVHAIRNRNNVDPSQSAAWSEDNGRVITLGDTSFDQLEVGNFDSFTSDGFDIDFTTVDSVSHVFFALMMGDGSGPPFTGFVSRRFFL